MIKPIKKLNLFIGFFLVLNINNAQANVSQDNLGSYEDSVKAVLENADDTKRAELVADFTRNANFYSINHEPFETLLEEAFEWEKAHPNKLLLSTLRLGKVNILIADQKPLEAVRVLTELLSSRIPLTPKDSVSAYTFLFGIYMNSHAYAEAWQTLMIRESVLSNNSTSTPFFESFETIRIGDLARVYLKLGENDKAIIQYKKLIMAARSEDNLHMEAGALNDLGLTWLQKNEPDSAIAAFQEAIDRWKLLLSSTPEKIAPRESIFLEVMLGSIGSAYNKKGQYNKAIPLLNTYLKANRKVKRYEGIAYGLNYLSQSYFGFGKYKRSQALLDTASNILSRYPTPSAVIENLETRVKVLEKLGRQESAFKAYKKLVAFKDSIATVENKERLEVMQVVYEVEKKDKEIQRQKLRAVTAETESRENETRSNILLVGLLSSILVGAIFVALTIQWRKKNKYIAKQNKIIERSLQEKEILLKEIHHRVKNNLQIISSFLNLQKGSIKDETTVNALDNTQLRVMSMSLVHETLYSKDDIKDIDIAEYIPKLLSHITIILGVDEKEVDVIYNLSSIKIETKTAIPLGLILNELITNAYKYAFSKEKKGQLNITASEVNGYINLVFSDNGPGFDENTVSGASNKTLGLQLIDDMLHQLKAKKKVSNNDGTSYELLIPIK